MLLLPLPLPLPLLHAAKPNNINMDNSVTFFIVISLIW